MYSEDIEVISIDGQYARHKSKNSTDKVNVSIANQDKRPNF